MKSIVSLTAILLFHVCAHGVGIPDYSWCRDWIVKHCATNTPAKGERIFIGHDHSPPYASVISFHQGIRLRKIIDQTPYRKGTVTIWIMHEHPKETEPWGEFVTVKPSDKPDLEMRPSDILWIWIYEGDA